MHIILLILILYTQILHLLCKPASVAKQTASDQIYFPTGDFSNPLSGNYIPETTTVSSVILRMGDAGKPAGGKPDDKIYYPTDEFPNYVYDVGKPETTTVDIAPRFVIDPPPNCPPGEKLVGKRCRRVYRIQNGKV